MATPASPACPIGTAMNGGVLDRKGQEDRRAPLGGDRGRHDHAMPQALAVPHLSLAADGVNGGLVHVVEMGVEPAAAPSMAPPAASPAAPQVPATR